MQINSHLSVLVHDLAKKWGDKPALTFRKFGSDQWQTVSFNQFSLRVKQVSNALLNLGAKPQDKIAVFSQNCEKTAILSCGLAPRQNCCLLTELCALSVHRFWCIRYQSNLRSFLCQQQ